MSAYPTDLVEIDIPDPIVDKAGNTVEIKVYFDHPGSQELYDALSTNNLKSAIQHILKRQNRLDKTMMMSLLDEQPELVKKLIEKNAFDLNPWSYGREDTSQSLLAIIEFGDLAIFEHALKYLPLNPNGFPSLSMKDYHLTFSHGLALAVVGPKANYALGKRLLKLGANIADAYNFSRSDNLFVLCSEKNMNQSDLNGNTILHSLVNEQTQVGNRRGTEHIALAIECGADPSSRDRNFRTPFQRNRDNNHSELVKTYLFQQFISVRARDFSKILALAEVSTLSKRNINWNFALQIVELGQAQVNDEIIASIKRRIPGYVLGFDSNDNSWKFFRMLSTGRKTIDHWPSFDRAETINLDELPDLKAILDGKTNVDLMASDQTALMAAIASYNFVAHPDVVNQFVTLPKDIQAMIIERAFMAPARKRETEHYYGPSRPHAKKTYLKLRDKFHNPVPPKEKSPIDLPLEQAHEDRIPSQEQTQVRLAAENIHSTWPRTREMEQAFTHIEEPDQVFRDLISAHRYLLENSIPKRFRQNNTRRTSTGFFTLFHGNRARQLGALLALARSPEDYLAILNHQLGHYPDEQFPRDEPVELPNYIRELAGSEPLTKPFDRHPFKSRQGYYDLLKTMRSDIRELITNNASHPTYAMTPN